MKKTLSSSMIALLICAGMIFSLASCGASQKDIDAAKSEATAPLNEQIIQLENDIFEKQAQIDGLEDEKASLGTEKEKLESEKERLESEKEKLESEKSELENKIKCLEGDHVLRTNAYAWADDYSACTATQACTRTNCDTKRTLTSTSVSIYGTTLKATFDGAESTSIDIAAIKNKSYVVSVGENNKATYIIYNKAGLDAWATAICTDASTNLLLANDIEYNDSWTIPENNDPITYTGVIDGCGYAIKGLDSTGMASSYAKISTFIYALGKNGIIKHLGMEDGVFTNSDGSSGSGSYGFVFKNTGLIMGCYNASTCISTTSSESYGEVAGIAYNNEGTIITCYNFGRMSGGGSGGVGISNKNFGSIIGCYNTGEVTSNDHSYYIPTGISRINYDDGIIKDCYFSQPELGYKSSNNSGSVSNVTKWANSDWTNAMNAMNAAIEAYNADQANTVKCNYRYAVNPDTATRSNQPLIIVKAN